MDVLIADVIGDVGLVLILAKIFGFLAKRCGMIAQVDAFDISKTCSRNEDDNDRYARQ